MSEQQQVDVSQLEQAKRQINRLAEEIAALSETELSPAEYYGEFLQRLLAAIAGPAGAVWVRTPQGNLQLQYQINMRQVGLDRAENSRQLHDELLRQTALKGQHCIVAPQSSTGGEKGQSPAGNPTDHVILLAPILYDKQVAGLVEIWHDPGRGVEVHRHYLHFALRMAALASNYTRNHQLRQMVGQQQVWTQLETFARQIHASLNPTEVAYMVANDGRRLVEADRVSVGLRHGKVVHVQAISGADIVEKRSNLVQLMRALFEKVLDWGEKLVYAGTKDEALPPAVLKALDAYLAESNSKLLVVLPLYDERDTESKKPPRSALLMEAFETTASPEQAVARLEVVGRHAAPALYNAAEHYRIPMRFLWRPLAKLQDGLGGKAKAIWTLVFMGLGIFIAAMIFVPYPLRMEADGKILPKDRFNLYSPIEAQIRHIPKELRSGSPVGERQILMHLYSLELAKTINGLNQDIELAKRTIEDLGRLNPAQNTELYLQVQGAIITRAAKQAELIKIKERTDSLQTPGEFALRAPKAGIILNSDFRDLVGKTVRPSEALLRIGATDTTNPLLADWELELKIPQKNIGQVLKAFGSKTEFDVDVLLVSDATRTFKARLARDKVAAQAHANRDDNNEQESVVLAWARLSGAGIAKSEEVPTSLLLSDVSTRTRIRCGNRAMGYSLFHGVWEFIYEKIVFFF